MRKIFLIVLVLNVFCSKVRSQEVNLQEYLSKHQYSIHVNADSSLLFSSTLQEALSAKMKDKKLFIFGEGGSHFLILNHKLLQVLKKYFIVNGMRYFFVESDPGYAVAVNSYINSSYLNSELPFYKEYKPDFDDLKKMFNQGHEITYVGIDFTRPRSFQLAISNIAKHLDENTINKITVIAPYVKDTIYLTYDLKRFIKYYKDIRNDFARDSSTLKTLLRDQFSDFKELLTNANTALPNGDRDHPMAENLLNKLNSDPGAYISFLDCGGYHSRPNQKGTLANILSKSVELSGKIVVLNVFCENCITKVEKVSNWTLPFMKGTILESFSSAAKDDIVLFDLSELSSDYQYIKEYGDYLLYARNQN